MTIKTQINGLLGPLEAAARQDSLDDVADIANEIARLARAGLKLEDERKATIRPKRECCGPTHAVVYTDGTCVTCGRTPFAREQDAKRQAEVQRQLDAALVQSEALRPVPQAYPHGRWNTI